MTSNGVIVGNPVPWYRLNGWIAEAGGRDWMRHLFVVFGFVVVRSPWIYIGPLDETPNYPPWTSSSSRRCPACETRPGDPHHEDCDL